MFSFCAEMKETMRVFTCERRIVKEFRTKERMMGRYCRWMMGREDGETMGRR